MRESEGERAGERREEREGERRQEFRARMATHNKVARARKSKKQSGVGKMIETHPSPIDLYVAVIDKVDKHL